MQSLDKDYVCEQYNIGSGVGTSNLEIVKKIERYYGPMKILKTDKRPGDPAVLVANIDKVKADLNWKPTHSSVDNIIGSVIQWYNNINKKDLN